MSHIPGELVSSESSSESSKSSAISLTNDPIPRVFSDPMCFLDSW